MHEPVLLKPVLEYLAPQKGDSYLDVTSGYGGHAGAILNVSENYGESVLVDRDQMAISELTKLFSEKGVTIIKNDFYTAAEQLAKEGRQFDMILADLGVSSPHLDIASRGFSFAKSGPLDMRMDQAQSLTAAEIANEWPEEDIAKLIRVYGEEPKARRVAQAMVQNRPYATTDELAKVIARAIPGKWGAKHPATRTFQALRIAVNEELELLTKSIPIWVQLLKPGGRLGIISFHSLEDRIVKRYFSEHAGDRYDVTLQLLTKHPVEPSEQEIAFNPRSRSSKLRVAAKIKNNERASDAH
jgi:16S rRNA (cytosine1402-N4)-methyltransferase